MIEYGGLDRVWYMPLKDDAKIKAGSKTIKNTGAKRGKIAMKRGNPRFTSSIKTTSPRFYKYIFV